jgi:hypothetical protein
MKARPFILRCAAFLLIIIFSQKAGTGLFIHNLLHADAATKQLPSGENSQGNSISYACNCIDDFLMPFVETEEPVCFQSFSTPVTPVIFYKDEIPFHPVILSSLRGPPFMG